jgi:predicted nucleotidyltransferase
MEKRGIKSFCRENGIDLLVLFGSSATNRTHIESDMDVAVKCGENIKISRLRMIYELDGFFNGKKIDLVLLSPDTDPLLLYEIFCNGKCLYESRKGLFKKEKLRAWKLYLDTGKIRKMNEKYLKNYVKKVSRVA